jgi:H+/Cl- antiporter ClcA
MSDALENKAVEILGDSQEAIKAFADKLGNLAEQYSPEVVDAALAMARIDAIQTLVPGVVCGAIGYALYRVLKKAWPWIGEELRKHGPDPSAMVTLIFGGGGVGALILAAVLQLANVWAWVGIFEPKLWVAKRILGL